jgi:short-subunit dehydrogenase
MEGKVAPNARIMKVSDVQVVAELEKQGVDKIDVVIANAAVNLGCGDSFKDIDVDLQDETHRINVSRSLPFFRLQFFVRY